MGLEAKYGGDTKPSKTIKKPDFVVNPQSDAEVTGAHIEPVSSLSQLQFGADEEPDFITQEPKTNDKPDMPTVVAAQPPRYEPETEPNRANDEFAPEVPASISKLFEPIAIPNGIDPRPFRHIRVSDLTVRRPDLKRQVDPYVLERCVAAVQETNEVLNETTSDGRPLYETQFTEAQTAAHLDQYVDRSVNAISTLASDIGHVTVAVDLIGGLAHGHAVMQELGKHPDLVERIDVVPIFKKGFKPEKVMQRVANNNSRAFVHLDDGATFMTTQAGAMGTLTGNPMGQEYIRQINGIKQGADSCMDPVFDPIYLQMIQDSMRSNFVIMPSYMKNSRYRQLIGEAIIRDPNTPWAQAQLAIMDEGTVKHLDEQMTAVGSMVNNMPCRDHGVKGQELIERRLLDPKVEAILQRAGLGDSEFRLLANEKKLLKLLPGSEQFITDYFARILNETIKL